MKTTLERFEEKYTPEPNSGCWLWTAAVAGIGKYGNFWDGNKNQYAHRYSYMVYKGEITEENIDHTCSNSFCVNPDHLEQVSLIENLKRTRDRGRGFTPIPTNGWQIYCPYDHPYLGDNLYVRPNGSRECRECARQRQRLRTKRRKEARLFLSGIAVQ